MHLMGGTGASESDMAETAERTRMTPQLWEAMRQSDEDNRWLEEHQEALEPYGGQWIVVYRKRIIAHGIDGREVARAAPAARYPGSTMFYVPTREESEAVRI
jgi:hypothetical protein